LPYKDQLSPIEDIIEDARNGRMFILVDDEERENEGDLVIPGQMATPDAINFMAKYGRGLICLSLDSKRVEELQLPLMARANESRHQTAFTVSIEAREGVSTGISASDRARTIAVAIDPDKGIDDVVTPGHVFPLAAKDGGVLVRAGHTEAAIDISRLAGLNASGVICEIMNEDGTMARMPDLVTFAQLHGLKIATIADLIAYRLRHDRVVEQKIETEFESIYGGTFKMHVYANQRPYAEHIALVKGVVSKSKKPVLVRMHGVNILPDILGEASSNRVEDLHTSMKLIDEEGCGVIVLLREPSSTNLSDRIQSSIDGDGHRPAELREYGVGAQILVDLGVSEMVLLSNVKRNIVGLEGYGLSVIEQRSIPQERK
jgi:3,4-dihydroxy 2-butanone 4-phosphate synthase/GTP cyclohydrolase II